jgi:hypothetical protein
MLVLVLLACCAAASVCGYRRQLHGFVCLSLEALENVMPMLQKKIMQREREREMCLCLCECKV